jgi:hypothetical protein
LGPNEAAELLARIAASYSYGFAAKAIGLSERTLEQIRLGKVAATPETMRRLRKVAKQAGKSERLW